MKNYKIAVAGTGYVGLSLGVLFAQHHQVVAVDIVQAKVDMIPNKLLTSLKCCFHWIHAIRNDLFIYIFQLFLPSLLQPVYLLCF